MRRVLLLGSVLLLIPVAAQAAPTGLNLGWRGSAAGSECPSLGQSFMCDRCDNSESHQLVGSVVAPAGIGHLTAEELYVEVQYQSASTPPEFWRLASGGCRDGSLYMDAAFPGFSTTVCEDYWGTSASGGYDWRDNQTFYGVGCDVTIPPDSYQASWLRGVFARVQSTATALTEGTEYYVFKVRIDDLHSAPDPTSPGICSGCDIPVCITFQRVLLDQPTGVGDIEVTGASTRNTVTWQDPSYCAPIAVRRASWGQMKSLYR